MPASPNGTQRIIDRATVEPYPGCGAFYRPASCAAITGRLVGISLASKVAPECGHIPQIGVSAAVRGTGIGYALLRQSLTTFQAAECRSTV